MSIEKPHIFLDFDNLKFHTTPAHIEYVNHTYGVETVYEDYLDMSNLHAVLQKYENKNIPSYDDFWNDIGINFLSSKKWHENVEPFPDMCEVIYELANKYTLWTVTARQRRAIEVVKYLIDKHIPNCINDIHCVWVNNEDGAFYKHSKKDFIESIKGEKVAFIDDTPREIYEMDKIIPSYLFDPAGRYNHLVDIPHRFGSWKEIGETFL